MTTVTGATHDNVTLAERGPRSVDDRRQVEADHLAVEGRHLDEQGHLVARDLHYATGHHSVEAVLEGMA